MYRAFRLLISILALGICVFGCASGGDNTLPTRSSSSDLYMLTPSPIVGCLPGAPEKQWAAVIGVNSYQDPRIPDLNGAVNDAWVLFHYLASPKGGQIDPQRLQLLLNKEATHKNVMGVLGNFLAQACPQDQVIIYFAGHGAPEPKRPEESFLLLHDTDLSNLVGSAIAMSRLPNFLKWRTGQTGRLLMIVDACHAGAIQFPDQTRGALPKDRVQLVSASLDRVVAEYPGWGALSAAASDQFAMEATLNKSCSLGGQPYRGGVFTCRVLEGLVGKADGNQDGTVALDEMVAHLNQTVPKDTDGQQQPQLSGNLEGGMPLALVKPEGFVSIPPIPDAYKVREDDTSSLQPYLWAGAGLTGVAAITGAVFHVRSELLAADINSGITGKDDEFERLQNTAIISYAVAGGLLALTVAGWFIEGYEPEQSGINDVYNQSPWFELVPQTDGAVGTLRLTW